MWRLFRHMRMYKPGYSVDTFMGECPSTDQLPLDPVECAGCVNVRSLETLAKKRQCSFAKNACEMLIRSSPFFPVHSTPSERRTAKKWTPHLHSLCQMKVVEKCDRNIIKHFGRYFATPKNESMARCIFDGSSLDGAAGDPPTCNLAELTTLLRELSVCRKPKFIIGDLRHWFHQLPISEDLRNHFGVSIDGEYYRWCVLPMGWQYSPRLAQCISNFILLEALSRAGVVVDFDSHHPPAIFKSSTVVACVWYDNFIIATTDGDLWDRVYFRLPQVCAEFNIVLKEWERYGNGMAVGSPLPKPCFLGLEFALDYGQLIWRHIPKKLMKLASRIRNLGVNPTLRQVAEIIGFAIWDSTIALRPLLYLSSEIEILRKVSICSQTMQWNGTVHLSDESSLILHSRCSEIARNVWITIPPFHQTEVVYVATDSSDKAMGMIEFRDFQPYHVIRQLIPSDMVDCHIYIKELLAATIMIERTGSLHPGAKISIAIDNTAVVYAIRRMFTCNKVALELLRRIEKAVASHHLLLECIPIPGALNPADDPSRMRLTICPDRINAFRKVCMDHERRQGMAEQTISGRRVQEFLDDEWMSIT